MCFMAENGRVKKNASNPWGLRAQRSECRDGDKPRLMTSSGKFGRGIEIEELQGLGGTQAVSAQATGECLKRGIALATERLGSSKGFARKAEGKAGTSLVLGKDSTGRNAPGDLPGKGCCEEGHITREKENMAGTGIAQGGYNATEWTTAGNTIASNHSAGQASGGSDGFGVVQQGTTG